MNIKYTIKNLNCLKACFYKNLSDGDPRLNIGLNVFFGNSPKNDTNWKASFKERIIQLTEKRSEGQEATIERKEISKQNLADIETITIITEGSKKWREIQKSLEAFLTRLKLELDSKQLERTLVYEAPPYKITYSIDNKSTEFIANFIFEDNCSSAYAQSIKDWVNSPENPREILAIEQTGFFDVIPIPIPITSKLRTLWATEPKFEIDGKRIFMYFFEWAMENYLERLKKKDIKVSDDHKVAIGVPHNNAVTLYEYYESKKPEEDKGLLKELLTPNNFEKKDNKYIGIWLQHYKSSIISPGNKPLGKLIENAFK